MNTADSLLSSFSMLIQDDRTFSLWLGDFIIQSSLLLGVVWLLTSVAKKMSPARKHILMTAGMLCVPLLLLASISLPSLQWTLLSPNFVEVTPNGEVRVSDSSIESNATLRPELSVISQLPIQSSTSNIDFSAIICATWAGISTAIVSWILIAKLRLSKIAKNAKRETDDSIHHLLVLVAAENQITRQITLLRSDESVMPMTWGTRQPMILVPLQFTNWTQKRQLLVIRHEVAHIARHDAMWSILTLLSSAVCWFHPMMWLVWARTNILREQACDDHVILTGNHDAHDYANELVATLRDFRGSFKCTHLLPSLALAMTSKVGKIMKNRICHAIRENASRDQFRQRGRWALTLIASTATILLSGMSACRDGSTDSKLNNSLDDERVYFLTDTQWKQLTTSPMSYTVATPVKSTDAGEQKLRASALMIRTRLLESGVTFSPHKNKDVLTLRDERTMLVCADDVNQEKIQKLLASYSQENFVRIDSKVFTLPISDGFSLIPGDSQNSDQLSVLGILTPEQADATLKKISTSKDVMIVSAPTVVAKNHQTAKIEIIREFIYPTAFDPPHFSQSPGTLENINDLSMVPTTPTAFEMRPVGLQFEATAEILPEGIIHLDVAPDITYFDGYVDYGSPIKALVKDASGNPIEITLTESRIQQPIFRSLKCQTSVTLKDGHYVVLGGLSTYDSQASFNEANSAKKFDSSDKNPDRLIYFMIRVTKVSK